MLRNRVNHDDQDVNNLDQNIRYDILIDMLQACRGTETTKVQMPGHVSIPIEPPGEVRHHDNDNYDHFHESWS